MGDTNFRRTSRRTAQGPYRIDEQMRRRAEAQERNTEWAALSDVDKVASLRRRQGASRKQMQRLGGL